MRHHDERPISTRPLFAPRPASRSIASRVQQTTAALSILVPFLGVGCEMNGESTGDQQTHAEFAFAGIVEGFYGTPWSHRDRMDIVSFMGETGLNTYVYAPKDDPYHLERWRDPYPTDQTEQLRELIQHAADQNVVFWYAISPGGSMQYSSQQDYATLLSKIDAMGDLGVRHFGLFLDDVPLRLQHENDRQQFATVGNAHVSLVNRLHSDLASRGFSLMVTPTVYTSAWGNPEYLDTLGARVDPDVLIVWTGPDVVSDSITSDVSTAWAARAGRRVVLWDNYPVNDFAPWRVFLGPLRGRATDLPGSTIGILSNPMNQAHASMLALWTLADYTRDPIGYDAEQSHAAAVEHLFGNDAADHVRQIDDVFGDYASDVNVFERLYFLRDTIDLAPVENTLDHMEAALDALAGSNAGIVTELRPILQRNRSRLDRLRSDDRYLSRDGLTLYRGAIDDVPVPNAQQSIAVDGTLTDWNDTQWRQLHGRLDAHAAFRYYDGELFVAVRIRGRAADTGGSPRIGDGAQIQLVLDRDASGPLISSEDLFVLVTHSAASGSPDVFIGSMRFEGFMAKWLADNEAMFLTDFHLTTFGTPPSPAIRPVVDDLRHAASVRRNEFVVELALPWEGWSGRISLTARMVNGGSTSSASLAARNYPANPTTFARLRHESF